MPRIAAEVQDGAYVKAKMERWNMRQAILIRVGADSTYGGWNAPVNPCTGEFAYVPIPEDEGARKDGIKRKPIREVEGCRITYERFKEPCGKLGKNLPSSLLMEGKYAHLDPDFEYLTYGDEHNKAKRLCNLKLSEADLLVFYSALQSTNDNRSGHLCYAIIGFYEVACIVHAKDIPQKLWYINAHTRREPKDDDIVFFGKAGKAGRLSKCIGIGEYRRDKMSTYWIREDLCSIWGEPEPIYIQRSGALPSLKNPERFHTWFQEECHKHGIQLLELNNLA
jgi:hypothetical protein